MKKNIPKIFLFPFVLYLMLFYHTVSASSIYSQPDHSVSINFGDYTAKEFPLGTGLSGTLGSISFYYSTNLVVGSDSFSHLVLAIYDCPDNTYTSCSVSEPGAITYYPTTGLGNLYAGYTGPGIYTLTQHGNNTNGTNYDLPFITIFNPTHYYKLQIFPEFNGSVPVLYGNGATPFLQLDTSPLASCSDEIQNQNETGVDVGGVCHLDNEGEIPMPTVTFKSISGYNAIFNVDMSHYYPHWINSSDCLNSNLPHNTYFGYSFMDWYSASGVPSVDPFNINPNLNIFVSNTSGHNNNCLATSFDMVVPILGDNNHWNYPNIADGNYSVTVSIRKLTNWPSVVTTNSYFRFNFTVSGGVVVTGSCSDNIKNQNETDVDIGGVCQKIQNNPVLIIPGVLGTEISKPTNDGPEKLWLDIVHTISDPLDEFMDPLQFHSDLTPIDNSLIIEDVIRKKISSLAFDYTDGLIKEFQDQGYEEGTDLFLFPYDWRYGVSEDNINKLKQKIEDIRKQTGRDEVDVIAHSTGGLLIKKYVMNNPADNHVGKAVFVGVPNTGAPQAVKTLIQGSNFNVPLLADEEMKKIAKNLPVVYDLSPSQEYYNQKGSYIKVIDLDDPLLPNGNDLNFTESQSFLVNDHKLNAKALTNANNLHTSSFDNYDLRTAGVDLYAIDGCRAGTFTNLVESRKKDESNNIKFSYLQAEALPGDGTVPLESSTNLPINTENRYYALKSDHSKMLSRRGIKQQIVNLITGSFLSTKDILNRDIISQDVSNCRLNGKAIVVYSPVDIDVIDQDNNHAGLSNGGIQNDIPNASFDIMGDHKFVYLPNDEGQTYNVKLKGVGNGTLTIKSQNISNNNVTQTEVFSNIPITSNLSGQINLGDATTISLDHNDDGVMDQTIQPSSVINHDESKDFISPISTSTISGSIGHDGFYHSDVSINISAVDRVVAGLEGQASGVLKTFFNLDDTGVQEYTAPINIRTEGKHILKFFSTDKAGNNETEQAIGFNIDKTSPELVVSFDTNSKDVVFRGQDNLDQNPKISTNKISSTITDISGNKTVIPFNKYRDLPTRLRFVYNKIIRNGVTTMVPNTNVAYDWKEKRGAIVDLDTRITIKGVERYVFSYRKATNTTTIKTKTNSGIKTTTKSGFVFVKVKTEGSELKVSY